MNMFGQKGVLIMAVVLLAGMGLVSCSHQPPRIVEIPKQCEVQGKTQNPMVVNWSAAKKAIFETQSLEQIVVVRFDGCEMAILDGCQVYGKYQFKKTARSQSQVLFKNKGDVENKLGFDTGDLNKELDKSGDLRLSYVTAGTKTARISAKSKGMMLGNCDGATHFVRAVVVGAYNISSSNGNQQTILRAGGNVKACSQMDTPSRSPECSAMVEMNLVPVSEMNADRSSLYVDNAADEIDKTIEQEDKSVGEIVAMMEALRQMEKEQKQKRERAEQAPANMNSANLTGVAAEIANLPNGGSDEWDRLVAPLIVKNYDKNASESIDKKSEVESIPCDVIRVLDQSVRLGRGHSSALRTTYGFPADFAWVGNALGFDVKIRVAADAHMQKCGI